MRTKKISIEAIIALLILMFLYAAVSKLLSYDKFVFDMGNQPFPNWTTPLLIWGVPISELLIVVVLLFERTRKIGLWASTVLMGIFTVYIILILMKVFPYTPCSCGGVIDKLSWTQHLYFNIFFLVISIIGLILMKKTINSRHKPFQSAIA